jgi:hypothetical protein
VIDAIGLVMLLNGGNHEEDGKDSLDYLDALICLETNKNMIHNLTNIYCDLKEAIE